MEEETVFERLARERNITVEEMRAIISARIEAGMNDPDPEKRAQWERIPRAGKIPTPEEWLRYAVERIEAEGRGDLLRLVSESISKGAFPSHGILNNGGNEKQQDAVRNGHLFGTAGSIRLALSELCRGVYHRRTNH